jgi:hypothetical protein
VSFFDVLTYLVSIAVNLGLGVAGLVERLLQRHSLRDQLQVQEWQYKKVLEVVGYSSAQSTAVASTLLVAVAALAATSRAENVAWTICVGVVTALVQVALFAWLALRPAFSEGSRVRRLRHLLEVPAAACVIILFQMGVHELSSREIAREWPGSLTSMIWPASQIGSDEPGAPGNPSTR